MTRLSRATSNDQRESDRDVNPTPAASVVLEALGTTAHAIFRFAGTKIADLDVPEKLSGARLRVLFAVKEAGSMRMGDLATQLGVAPRTVTDLVDGLEKEGLLTRRPDPTDRRCYPAGTECKRAGTLGPDARITARYRRGGPGAAGRRRAAPTPGLAQSHQGRTNP